MAKKKHFLVLCSCRNSFNWPNSERNWKKLHCSLLWTRKTFIDIDNLLPVFAIIICEVLKLLLDCFTPHQWPIVGVYPSCVHYKKWGLFVFWCHVCRQALIAFFLAAHFVSELVTNGYYSECWDPFGVLSGRRVWKFVSVDPWPRPAESQCVSFYGNGEIVTTSQQRPAACRLLNRAHLQKTEGPREMGSDPSSHRLSHIRSYIDIELA